MNQIHQTSYEQQIHPPLIDEMHYATFNNSVVVPGHSVNNSAEISIMD